MKSEIKDINVFSYEKEEILKRKVKKEEILKAGANKVPTVYFLFEENNLIYIGQTQNIKNRISDHVRDKCFDSVFHIDTREENLNKVEEFYIRKFNPPLNIQKNDTYFKKVDCILHKLKMLGIKEENLYKIENKVIFMRVEDTVYVEYSNDNFLESIIDSMTIEEILRNKIEYIEKFQSPKDMKCLNSCKLVLSNREILKKYESKSVSRSNFKNRILNSNMIDIDFFEQILDRKNESRINLYFYKLDKFKLFEKINRGYLVL